jgi:hypothetical protein
MSILKLMRDRQMYKYGQRVAKTLDGSRPGYRGSDYGDQAKGTGAYSGGPPGNTGDQSTDRTRTTATQDYNTAVATGQNPLGIDMSKGPPDLTSKETKLQNFYNTRPKVNIPNFGLSGMFLNLFNKGVNSPIQKFADFGAKKNRSFFEDVIRAGKIPGLDFGTVADMTPEQLENAYGSYMDNRMSGATDAYGNPIGDQGGGITNLVDYNTFNNVDGNIEDENIEVASDPFTSRFLQNQPEDIRAEIESRMQNYYTV